MTADTGRQDYDQALKITSLQAGEPIFVIRGRDLVAGPAVRCWAALADKAGAPAEALELALQQADRLDAWPEKKAPDGPDLDDNARKQLRYEHSRRAWAARDLLKDETALLAAQAGRDQVLGGLRSALGQLKMVDGRVEPNSLKAVFDLVGWDTEARLKEIDQA